MKQVIKRLLHQLPYIQNLEKQIGNQGLYPAGHYYSPIPAQQDVQAYLSSLKHDRHEFPDINFNTESQFKLLEEYRAYYDELPFPEHRMPGCRYYFAQEWFCYADAIFLYCFLRKHAPRRIVEVGSGFSSAVILDTAERFFNHQAEIVFIEPYPERLMDVLQPSDKGRVSIESSKVQDVPIELFTALGPGDLLFIDSSHVVKCGSDVQQLMFNILPKLSPGVFVHFHDVFYPFEYPSEWFNKGRYWNEIYFIRAFLSYNSQWRIYFFNDHVARTFKRFLEDRMPLCLKNTGGSIYIQRLDGGTAA